MRTANRPPDRRRPPDHELIDAARRRLLSTRGPGCRLVGIVILTADGCRDHLHVSAEMLVAARGSRPTPAPDGPAAPSEPEAAPNRSELLAAFLSDDARAILRELAARQPCQAQEVLGAVAGRVGKSNFWPVWKSLQVRTLVVECPGGFRLGPPWLAGLVATA